MLKVLVVDDSLAIQRSLGRLLTSIGTVEVIGTAEEVAVALRLIDALRPDAVVLDANLLDGESGIAVLHHVTRRWPQMAVIVLSNTSSDGMRRVYLDAGAQAFFDKATEFMQARDWIAGLAARKPD